MKSVGRLNDSLSIASFSNNPGLRQSLNKSKVHLGVPSRFSEGPRASEVPLKKETRESNTKGGSSSATRKITGKSLLDKRKENETLPKKSLEKYTEIGKKEEIGERPWEDEKDSIEIDDEDMIVPDEECGLDQKMMELGFGSNKVKTGYMETEKSVPMFIPHENRSKKKKQEKPKEEVHCNCEGLIRPGKCW